jgi:DUF4097 and DUF4098 domain-containing protein YvlB
MKRGSFIAPLLLILIGVVFLLKNLNPELPLFDWLATYWPFLLIGWGVLRLAEVFYWHKSGRPLPISGVGGGEWALIIILTIVGTSVWGVQRLAHGGLGKIRIGGVDVFGESFDFPYEAKSVKAGKGARIVLDNPRGAVKVIGVEGEEVKLTGRKVVRALDKAAADKAHADSTLEFAVNGGVVTVRTSQGDNDGPRVSSDLEIMVPKDATIEARGRSVDFDISDVAGGVEINSEKSGVRLQNIGGRIVVDTRSSDIIRVLDAKGDVELKGRGRDIELENIAGQVMIDGSYSGETSLRKLAKPARFESPVTEFKVEGVPGEVRISLSNISGTDIKGPLTLKAKSKDLVLAEVTDSVTVDIDRGDIELRQSKPPQGRIDVQVRSGDIELAVPQTSKFSLNAVTERGDVTNDFDSRIKEDRTDRSGKLTGSLGGGPEVKLTTSRGEITVRKISPAESANLAPEAEPKSPKPPKVPEVPAPPRANNQ